MLEILSSNCEVFDIFLDLESHRNQAKEKKKSQEQKQLEENNNVDDADWMGADFFRSEN